MTRYTVTYSREALAALTRLWMSALERDAIGRSGDEVDRVLRDDATHKVIPVGSNLRQLVVTPLVVEFTVEEDDRRVTIWSVRHIGRLTNGH
jgi:hypothetical protein